MSVESLALIYPWPAEKPDVPPDDHGWCQPEHREWLGRYLTPETKVIVELGCWLGQSTRLMLELAPNATIVCVDHWKGDVTMNDNPETQSRLSNAYETFLVNQWEQRSRIVPLRKEVQTGLYVVSNAGISPDFIFFDAEHTAEVLNRELRLAYTLFPDAQLYGDDWGWEAVQTAVNAFAMEKGMTAAATGNAWALEVAKKP